MASASGCYQGGAKSFAQHGVMRFVAALLGLRAQDMKTGAPAHFHLRCATVKTSHTPGTNVTRHCAGLSVREGKDERGMCRSGRRWFPESR